MTIDTLHEVDPDEDERFPWVVCGRTVGSVSGWDQMDVFVFTVYELEPMPGLDIPPGDVTFDYAAGTWATFFDNGLISAHGDLLDAIKDIPSPCLN